MRSPTNRSPQFQVESCLTKVKVRAEVKVRTCLAKPREKVQIVKAEAKVQAQVEVQEVEFKLDDDLIRVSGFGDIPLYKTHAFEKEIKTWL